MELIYSFDPTKFALGNVCKRGHVWPSTSQSLRAGSRIGTCVGCRSKSGQWLVGFLSDVIDPTFDTSTRRLGKLCKAGHDYEGTGMSLRLKSNTHCCECERIRHAGQRQKEYKAAWEKANRERENERHRRRYQALRQDPEAWQAKLERHNKNRRKLIEQGLTVNGTPRQAGSPLHRMIERGIPLERLDAALEEHAPLWAAIKAAGQAPTVAQLAESEIRRYWRENPGSERRYTRQFVTDLSWLKYQLSADIRRRHREKSKRRKALMRGNVATRVSSRDIRDRFRQFENCCAYCGASGDLHIEHFIPITKGGTHALGNILPACQPCNYSKRDHQPEEWYRSQEFFSELRWRKIRRVLNQTQAVGQLSLM